MWQRHRMRVYVFCGGALALLALPCMGMGRFTGVSGTVSLSPAGPGPQRAGKPNTAPYRGAAVALRNAQGSVVARAVADAQGRFTIAVPAGIYQVQVDVQQAAFPRCEPVEITVPVNRMARVEMVCDSGMR